MNAEVIFKKGLIAAAIIFVLMIIVLTDAPARENDFPPGAVLVWRNSVVAIFLSEDGTIVVPASYFERTCNNIDLLWQHFDVHLGNGTIVTSTPQEGGGYESIIESRVASGTWTHLAVLVKPDIDMDGIETNMDALDGSQYDWFMYLGQQWDLICSCGENDRHRKFWKLVKELLGGDYSHCVNYSLGVVGYADVEATPYGFVERVRDGEIEEWSLYAEYEIVDGTLVEITE